MNNLLGKCPNCGFGNFDINFPKSKLEMYSIPLNTVYDSTTKLVLTCKRCKFNTLGDELITDEEFKNKQRVGLIERMLK